jgi:glutamine synthetase
VWPPEVDVDQAGAAIAPLPSSLGSALDALERDEVAVEWFPPVLLTTFLSVKRAELDELSGLDDAALCRRVSDVY